jgi:hypothetical protein
VKIRNKIGPQKDFFALEINRRIVILSILYLVTILLNLVFRSGIPIHAAFESPHDDQLGVELAANILNGEWLGAWNSRTLAKPPGYSLYLVFTNLFPVKLSILNQLFYVISVGLLLFQIKRYFICTQRTKEILVYLIFLFLIFQPILFYPDTNRVYRSSVPAITLTFIFIVLLLRITDVLCATPNFRQISRNQKFQTYILFGLLSLTCGAMELLRFENFWIRIMSFLTILFLIVFKAFQLKRNRNARNAFFRFLVPVPIVVTVLYALPIFAVQEANRVNYGVALTENYFKGSFPEAINLWSSVDVGRDPRPYVIVSAAQRVAVYEVSETASLLRPLLESKEHEWFPACNSLKLCDNSGAWFTWQIRDLAVLTGFVYSERTFQQFFQNIANDIAKACDQNRFACVKASTLVGSKPVQDIPKLQLLEYVVKNLRVLLPFNRTSNLELTKTDIYGAPQPIVNLFHQVVNYETPEELDQRDLKKNSRS